MNISNLKGLVLAGGKSRRMQQDKATLVYHQAQTQAEYCQNLLNTHLSAVYLSCRATQTKLINTYPQVIVDTMDIGPLGGILSAFAHSPNVAWLVMACDMPLLSPQTLHTLITNRNPNVSASVFYHAQKPSKPLEPLLSIWEPVAYGLLKNYVQKGKKSVKGFLEQTNCERIPIQQSIEFSNANTPKENKQIKAYLKNTALTTDIKH